MQSDPSLRQLTRNFRFRTFWLGILAILLVLLAYERWLPGGGTLTPEEGLRGRLEVGLVVCAYALLLFVWGKIPLLRSLQIKTFVALTLFGIYALISSTWSPNYLLSAGKAIGLLSMVLVAGTLAYKATWLELSIPKMVLISLFIMIALLFLENLFYFGSLLRLDYSSNRPRMVLGFDHPNGSSEMFGPGLLAGFYLLLRSKPSKSWLIILLGTILMGSGLVLTNSRAAILAGAVSMGLILIAKLKPGQLMVFIIFVIATMTAAIFILNFNGYLELWITDLINHNPDILTLNGRLGLWDTILTNPINTNIVGIGYFGTRYITIADFQWAINSHNAYLEVFFTTGLIGLLLMAAFYFFCIPLLKSWRNYSLPLALLAYGSINNFTEAKLFSPGVLMFLTCIFIFHHHFLANKYRLSNQNLDINDIQNN